VSERDGGWAGGLAVGGREVIALSLDGCVWGCRHNFLGQEILAAGFDPTMQLREAHILTDASLPEARDS
jgi:hypothetical protein